ncbi:MAG: hypothetical protein II936_04270, partial [Oscillospiraceae bacterium]|nr:hypothetical protein [Oscillospiraceae bacterium]
MNIKRKPYSAKGAVLIMVLTVMFVLIFLLAGAVAVVYTSNNRVMMQYEESQAYYTARSVLETYKNALLSDNTDLTGGTYYYYDTTGASPAITSIPKVKQGRALELDLYSVPVCTDPAINPLIRARKDGTESYDAITKSEPKFNPINVVDDTLDNSYMTNFKQYADQYSQKVYWDRNANDSKSNVVDRTFTNDKHSFSQPGYNTVDAAFSGLTGDTICYELDSDLAGFQNAGTTTVVNKLADHGSKIRMVVQVLFREYDKSTFSGYVTDPTLYNSAAKKSELLVKSERANDNFWIRVVVEVTLNGEVTTTSAEFGAIPDPPKSGKGQALLSMGGVTGNDIISVIGGVASLHGKDISSNTGVSGSNGYWLQNGDAVTSGDVFLMGDIGNASGPKIHLDGDTNAFIAGNIYIKNDNFLAADHGGYNLVCEGFDISG